MTMNVTVIGNLTRDPELRFTASGDAVANFSVAVNERVREGDTYVDGEPSYYDVTAWKKFAENIAENLRKGDRVIVIGRMKVEKFAGRDGEQRSKPVITAEEVGSSVRFKGPGARPAAPADPAQDDIPPF
jgi:single-strand DNA-binding protein